MERPHVLCSVPTVRPFRALRYDPAVAGPLETLVAPPYDVISDAQRLDYLARSPYNVVHLTLPDSEEQAARDLADWRERGVLAEAPEGYWWVAQDYTGPDGVARTREGFAASVPAVPYEDGQVLPHERTHAGPKEGRLRLLRATRTQLEPIFLLYDADPVLERPAGEPAADVTEGGVRTRIWPVDAGELELGHAAPDRRRPPPLRDRASPTAQEHPEATHTFAILVSSRAPGLEIFPTHRLVQQVGEVPGEQVAGPGRRSDALSRRQVHPRRNRRRLRAARRRVVRAAGRLLHRVCRRGDRGRRPWRGRGRVPAAAGHGRAGRALRARRRDDAAEVDVLLPEAHLRAALPPLGA